MVLIRRYNPEIHHRRSIRLKGYDYTRPGYYFITICTKGRDKIFGKIFQKRIQLSDYGKILEMTWHDLPNHNKNILLDAYAIMPEHFHGIIQIIKKENFSSVGAGSEENVCVGAGSEPAPTEVIFAEPAPTESILVKILECSLHSILDFDILHCYFRYTILYSNFKSSE